VSLLQLRPGPENPEPTLWWLTACPKHQKQIRIWLRAGWPHDQVDTYGTAFLQTQDVQKTLHDGMEDTPILRLEFAG
jgi:hypothetical protein